MDLYCIPIKYQKWVLVCTGNQIPTYVCLGEGRRFRQWLTQELSETESTFGAYGDVAAGDLNDPCARDRPLWNDKVEISLTISHCENHTIPAFQESEEDTYGKAVPIGLRTNWHWSLRGRGHWRSGCVRMAIEFVYGREVVWGRGWLKGWRRRCATGGGVEGRGRLAGRHVAITLWLGRMSGAEASSRTATEVFEERHVLAQQALLNLQLLQSIDRSAEGG